MRQLQSQLVLTKLPNHFDHAKQGHHVEFVKIKTKKLHQVQQKLAYNYVVS